MGNIFFQDTYIGRLVEIGTLKSFYQKYLLEGENIFQEFKSLRDGGLITNRRLIIIARTGLTGKKAAIISIPWKSISAFSIENSGTFDLDSEMKICGMGFGVCCIKFASGTDLTETIRFINTKIIP